MPESDGGAKILEYIVEMKDITDGQVEYSLLGNTNGNVPNILVPNTQKGHSYMFRIYAKNEVGTSEPLITDEPIVMSPRISKFLLKNIYIYIYNI